MLLQCKFVLLIFMNKITIFSMKLSTAHLLYTRPQMALNTSHRVLQVAGLLLYLLSCFLHSNPYLVSVFFGTVMSVITTSFFILRKCIVICTCTCACIHCLKLPYISHNTFQLKVYVNQLQTVTYM